MITAPTDPRALAEAAIVALSVLVAVDMSLADAVARMVGVIRAKYPASAGPDGPPTVTAPKPPTS